MLKSKIISPEELSKYGYVKDLSAQVLALLKQQKSTWKTAAKNYEALNYVLTKEFNFGDFKLVTQFNPERIRSSAAKTDARSLAERPCFLCLENLPDQQKGILFQDKYIILINPYPIFLEHIVINGLKHVEQQIFPYIADMLDLSRNLPGFTVFYNGPQCGASAPDHFHFQAIGKNYLKIEKEFDLLAEKHAEVLVQDEKVKIIAVENYLRKFIAVISPDKTMVEDKFKQVYRLLDSQNGEEPMMNVLCNFTGKKWRVIIFPREKQRPSHFFKEDDDKIVIGPASVEMGGVVILPREEDFLKITKKEIEEIYGEVTINGITFKKIINAIKAMR